MMPFGIPPNPPPMFGGQRMDQRTYGGYVFDQRDYGYLFGWSWRDEQLYRRRQEAERYLWQQEQRRKSGLT